MSFWSKFPILRLALCFAAGIILANIYDTNLLLAYSILVATLLAYVVLLFIFSTRYYHKINVYIGLLACTNVCTAGYIQYANTDNSQDDLQKFVDVEAYRCISKENMHDRERSKSVLVQVTHVYRENLWIASDLTKIHLYIPKTDSISINYGDVLLVRGAPKPIVGPKRERDFDFRKFAKVSQIYYHSYARDNTINIVGNEGNRFYKFIYKLLSYSKGVLNSFIHDKAAYAVVCALLLGDKDAVDYNIRRAYTESGTMHVLAVSGLHVGVLYILLMWVISILHLGRKASLLGDILSIIALWFYAAITGFSASVLRATAMFSIVSVSKLIGRQSNIYNTLGISAIILLLVDPRMLFNVGFQLSYLAVLGIAYLTNKIYCILKFNNRALDKLWMLTSISFAAQMITMPLSLYYFGQLPTYFIIANWVVVPMATLILYLGLALLIVGEWAWLATKIAYILESIVIFLNSYLEYLQQLPYNLVEDIYASNIIAMLMYASMIAGLVFIYSKKYLWLVTILLLVIAQLGWWVIFNVSSG